MGAFLGRALAEGIYTPACASPETEDVFRERVPENSVQFRKEEIAREAKVLELCSRCLVRIPCLADQLYSHVHPVGQPVQRVRKQAPAICGRSPEEKTAIIELLRADTTPQTYTLEKVAHTELVVVGRKPELVGQSAE